MSKVTTGRLILVVVPLPAPGPDSLSSGGDRSGRRVRERGSADRAAQGRTPGDRGGAGPRGRAGVPEDRSYRRDRQRGEPTVSQQWLPRHPLQGGDSVHGRAPGNRRDRAGSGPRGGWRFCTSTVSDTRFDTCSGPTSGSAPCTRPGPSSTRLCTVSCEGVYRAFLETPYFNPRGDYGAAISQPALPSTQLSRPEGSSVGPSSSAMWYASRTACGGVALRSAWACRTWHGCRQVPRDAVSVS